MIKRLLYLERKIFAYSNGVFRKSDRDFFRRKVMRYEQGLDKHEGDDHCIFAMLNERTEMLHGKGIKSPYLGYNGEKAFITDDFREWFRTTKQMHRNIIAGTAPAGLSF